MKQRYLFVMLWAMAGVVWCQDACVLARMHATTLPAPSQRGAPLVEPTKANKPAEKKRVPRMPSLQALGPKALAQKREQAVFRGAQWMEQFLQEPKHFRAIGMDAVYIFVELAVTSHSPRVRQKGMQVARRLAQRLERSMLRPGGLKERDALIDALDLLSTSPTLGLPVNKLLKRAEERFRSYRSMNALHGVALQSLAQASEDEVFDVLMDAYTLEKVHLAYPRRFRVTSTLQQILRFLRHRPLLSFEEDSSPGRETFFDHAFLATHIAYVLNNYGQLRLKYDHFPSMYHYLRKNFAAVLQERDIELVGEIIDVFRSMGRSEVDDPLMRAGTLLLLQTQQQDGSWGTWQHEKEPYDAIHFTWCAVHGLRERIFLQNTAYHRRILQILQALSPSSQRSPAHSAGAKAPRF